MQWFMQCSASCLYQVCEAGSNGSQLWAGPSLAIQVGVASHATKAAGTKKVLASLCLALTTPFKGPASNALEKKNHGSDERTTTADLITVGLAQPLCNELTFSKFYKSTCRHVSAL